MKHSSQAWQLTQPRVLLHPPSCPSLRCHYLQEQRQSESGHNAAPRTRELGALWGSVVERELFVSSHERKYLGFMLFRILLPHLK